MWYNASLTNAAENFFYPSDVEIHHLETAQQLEFTDITVVSQGPLRAAVKAQVRYGQSLISVTVKFTLITPLAIKWPWIWVDFSWCHTGYDKSKFTFPLQLWHCSQLAPTPWNTEMWDHFRNSIKGSYNISCSRVTSWHMEPQRNLRDPIRLRPKADAQEYDMGHCQGKRLPIVPITMNT